MILFKQAAALQNYLNNQHSKGATIGFVPTMGALHRGHLSLLQQAKAETDIAVCSIFVNPTQFNNSDDFNKYPVTTEQDIALLTNQGCDVLFLPSRDEIYPAGFTAEQYDLGDLETVLEGQFRPGHYQGVCQVMDRLLGIVQPQKL
ncbi:MAG TPA: pantoate--beta-alanine ligase, partial [Flavisolibacter sp.]|nr:pantoate--beta-alanine ligase [Flavisolibacter sp.]